MADLERNNMEFETDRLVIRKPKLEDAEQIYINYTQDKIVTKYLVWEPHKELESTIDWIKHCMDIWDIEKHIPFIIWCKDEMQAIGMIHFNIHEFKADFGYVLGQKYWNQGIMTEAAKPIIKSLLSRETIYRIEATHDLENPASGRVMEKLGMKIEGVVRKYSLHPNISKIPRDCKLYSIVK